MIRKKTVKKDNRKIKSKKKEVDGIVFDSTLESVCYEELKKTGLVFQMQVPYEIIPAFKYNGKAIRKMIWTPDFYIPSLNLLIECKGRANESFPLRLKMFMYQHCKDKGKEEPMIVILKNQKEIKDYIPTLKDIKKPQTN